MSLLVALRDAFLPLPLPSRLAPRTSPAIAPADGSSLLTDEEWALMAIRNPRRRVVRRRCKRGHSLFEANAYVRPDGRIECRKCRALASARFRARQRGC
jgi:predicted branched-subunit amino acid permease